MVSNQSCGLCSRRDRRRQSGRSRSRQDRPAGQVLVCMGGYSPATDCLVSDQRWNAAIMYSMDMPIGNMAFAASMIAMS